MYVNGITDLTALHHYYWTTTDEELITRMVCNPNIPDNSLSGGPPARYDKVDSATAFPMDSYGYRDAPGRAVLRSYHGTNNYLAQLSYMKRGFRGTVGLRVACNLYAGEIYESEHFAPTTKTVYLYETTVARLIDALCIYLHVDLVKCTEESETSPEEDGSGGSGGEGEGSAPTEDSSNSGGSNRKRVRPDTPTPTPVFVAMAPNVNLPTASSSPTVAPQPITSTNSIAAAATEIDITIVETHQIKRMPPETCLQIKLAYYRTQTMLDYTNNEFDHRKYHFHEIELLTRTRYLCRLISSGLDPRTAEPRPEMFNTDMGCTTFDYRTINGTIFTTYNCNNCEHCRGKNYVVSATYSTYPTYSSGRPTVYPTSYPIRGNGVKRCHGDMICAAAASVNRKMNGGGNERVKRLRPNHLLHAVRHHSVPPPPHLPPLPPPPPVSIHHSALISSPRPYST